MPFTFPGRELPAELKPSPNQDKGGFLAPDAFTNPEHIRFAIKGALAGFICYLIFTLTAYPGIYTSVITCIVCSLSTVGASCRKASCASPARRLRRAGIYLTDVCFSATRLAGGFLDSVRRGHGAAAYVNFGSARISYCGSRSDCLLQMRPASLRAIHGTARVRDRLIGIGWDSCVCIINSRLCR